VVVAPQSDEAVLRGVFGVAPEQRHHTAENGYSLS
jgi:hypothetical protein